MEITLSTDITLEYRKVPTMLTRQVYLDNPAPRPPLVRVPSPSKEGEFINEENPADPDYIQALADHAQVLEEKMRRLLIKRGIVRELSDSEVAQVKELQSYWQEEFGKTLPGSNLEVFINYIAIQTPEDLQLVIESISGVSQPTPKE